MTSSYGQIQAESLRLIFQGSNEVISDNALDRYREEATFRVYLSGMPGAFNRCMQDLEAKQVPPAASFSVRREDGEESGGTVRIPLQDVVPEFAGLRGIAVEGAGYGLTEYREEGEILVLPVSYFDDGVVRVVYTKKLPRVTADTPDGFSVMLPEAVCAWIPYFIASELYRSDEPGEAGEMRNRYEASMEQLALSSSPRGTTRVDSLYDMTEV